MPKNEEVTPRFEMALARGSVLGIGVPGRIAIACSAGVLWVTAPDTGDLVLVAGDATTIENRGRIVIEALQTAEFDLETDRDERELGLFGHTRRKAAGTN